MTLQETWDNAYISHFNLSSDKRKKGTRWYLSWVKTFNHCTDKDWRKEKLEFVFFKFRKEVLVTWQKQGRITWMDLHSYVNTVQPNIFKKFNLTKEEREWIIDTTINSLRNHPSSFSESFLGGFINHRLFTVDEVIKIFKSCIDKKINLTYLNFVKYFNKKDNSKSLQELKQIIIDVDDVTTAIMLCDIVRQRMAKIFQFSFTEYYCYWDGEPDNHHLAEYLDTMKEIYQHYKDRLPQKNMLDKVSMFANFSCFMSDAEQKALLEKSTPKGLIALVNNYSFNYMLEDSKYRGYGYIILGKESSDIVNSIRVLKKLG